MSRKPGRRAEILIAAFLAAWIPALLAAACFGIDEGNIRIPSRVSSGVISESRNPVIFYAVVGTYIVIAIGLLVKAWQLARPKN